MRYEDRIYGHQDEPHSASGPPAGNAQQRETEGRLAQGQRDDAAETARVGHLGVPLHDFATNVVRMLADAVVHADCLQYHGRQQGELELRDVSKM